MTPAQVRRLLDSRREEKVVLGLERLKGALERLGRPQERYPSIIVAGTNAKGSVSAMLAAALREAGIRTGLTTSPHLLSVRERIRVDGRAISPTELGRCLERVRLAEEEPLTYFELVTAAAFLHFARAGVGAAVLEVGLGGRLDATNVVERPVLSVITTIGFDHTDWLGDTLAKIAREKAGVLRDRGRALVGWMPEEARASIEKEARRVGAEVEYSDDSAFARRFRPKAADWKRGVQQLDGPGGVWTLGVLGRRQADNASLVHRACDALEEEGLVVPEPALRRALAGVRWPGRFLVTRGARFVLDGAHNGQAAAAFAETWADSPFAESGSFIVGMLRDKDPEALLAPLAPWMREVQVVEPTSPRALGAELLAEAVRRAAPRAKVELRGSLKDALRAAPRRTTAVVGSFYLVGEACRLLEVPV